MSRASDPAGDRIELPAWMGDVDPSQIGFPLAVDRTRYAKETGIEFKRTPEGPLQLDVYRPVGVESPPLVVMIHGGGWHQGGRYAMGLTRWAGYLASAGLGVVSIDYRLAPATRYPDSFQDCIDAIDWAVEHEAFLCCDARRIGLWGDSAGGHLALLVATSQTRPDFAGPRLRCGGERLAVTVAWYPPTDLARLARSESRAAVGGSVVRSFVGVDLETDPELWRQVSPTAQAHAEMPPVLLLQGTRDRLVPASQARGFAARLAELGVRHELQLVEGAVHGFDRVAPGAETLALIAHSRDFLCKELGVSGA